MFRRRPAKQLDSKTVQNSLRANVLPLISKDLRAVACRAVWRVHDADVKLAKEQICSKRLELDDVIASIEGVQFFLSCVTALASNAKRSNEGNEGNKGKETLYPAVAYFIVFRPNGTCDESVFFSQLHKQDVDVSISTIRTRSNRSPCDTMENAARQLFLVVKDHKSEFVQTMCDESNAACYVQSAETSDQGESSQPNQPTHYPKSPCRIVVVNELECAAQIHAASAKLLADGMRLDVNSLAHLSPMTSGRTSMSEFTQTVEKIQKIMRLCHHALYRGYIYAKPAEAQMTFVKMMDVESYLNKLLATDAIREDVLKHFIRLTKVLAHPACEIVSQLTIDLDLVEVSQGYCLKVSARRFCPCPIREADRGRISPRAFVPYDCTTPPTPLYFQEGILNSFPDVKTRVNFLNKFYQCLMASRMPHKVRKLVVAGPKDSGKTSWASIFHRLIPAGNLASITNERQFSGAMITDETQLVLVDEWSVNTIQSDLAKTILQGGWMVTAVKHELPRCVMNNSPFYITTNEVPDFGEEDDNVKRRIAVFETTSLPVTLPRVDRWMYDHAMDCVAWLINEINTNIALVDTEELWYEPGCFTDNTIGNNEGAKLFDSCKLQQITHVDLEEHMPPIPSPNDAIHRSFAAESSLRRLARKRRMRSLTSSTNDEWSSGETECEEKGLEANNDGETSQFSADGHAREVRTDDEQGCIASKNPDDSEEESSGPRVQHTRRTTLTEPFFDYTATPETGRSSLHGHAHQVEPDDEQECVANENSDDSAEESFGPRVATPSCWVMNDRRYMAKVAELLKNNFDFQHVTRLHARSFIEKRRKAQRKRDRKEKEFWTKADPTTDAWMLIIGELREIFDVNAFVTAYPNIHRYIERVRRMVNVQVLPCSCPVFQEIENHRKATEGERREAERERSDKVQVDCDSQGLPRRPQLSSQTFWTKVKAWRPW